MKWRSQSKREKSEEISSLNIKLPIDSPEAYNAVRPQRYRWLVC